MDRKDVKSLLLLLLLFAASRAVLYHVRPFFYDEPLQSFMQFLDPEILRSDLLQGLLHMHSQPPLFNLLLGLVLKGAPQGYDLIVFASMYFILGAMVAVLTFGLMRSFGVSRAVSLILTLALVHSPLMLKAERWLYYGLPLAALLCAMAVTVHRFAQTGKSKWFAISLLLAAVVVLTRSFYHLIVWMGPIAVFLLYLTTRRAPDRVRLHTALTLIFVLAAGSLYVRNYVWLGMFTSSTWQGGNLFGMTAYVAADEKERLLAEGKITPLVGIYRWAPPQAFIDYYGTAPHTGIEVLDAPWKRNGYGNWNNLIYPRASQEYQRNAVTLVKEYPAKYALAVLNALYIFFGNKNDRFFWEFDDWGTLRTDSILRSMADVSVIYLVPLIGLAVFVTALYAWTRRLISGLRSFDDPSTRAGTALSAFALFNILYAFGISSLLELKENCFYRIPIDPFLAVGVGLFVDGIFRRARAKPPIPFSACATAPTGMPQGKPQEWGSELDS